MKKYRISESLVLRKGGIQKLERDGFSRCEIREAFHKATNGATHQEQNKLMSDLYDRRK